MTPPKDDSNKGPSVEEMFGQAFVAIGPASLGVMLTRGAVREIRKVYIDALRKNAARWDGEAVKALEFARGLGRIAAHRALAAGRNEIIVSDLRFAVRGATRAAEIIGPRPCPIC